MREEEGVTALITSSLMFFVEDSYWLVAHARKEACRSQCSCLIYPIVCPRFCVSYFRFYRNVAWMGYKNTPSATFGSRKSTRPESDLNRATQASFKIKS